MTTFALCNLGCSKNMIDGERMSAVLQQGGYTCVHDYARAEIILINTCTFIDAATQEAIDAVLEAAEYKHTGICRVLGVAGCFSQRYRAQIADQFPEVDVWFGTQTWQEEIARYFGLGRVESTAVTRCYCDSVTQYVRIAYGCAQKCSFCIIPSIRGPFRSRLTNDIVQEVRYIEKRGARECILVAQDTAHYGRDIGTDCASLLEAIVANTSQVWIRLMYCNPQWIDERLIECIAGHERICAYFDMPVQHSAPAVRAAMGRPLPIARVYRLIETVREKVPSAAIRTSLITGFPGETHREFRHLVRFVEDMRFDKLGVFPFSPQQGTPAHTMRPRPRPATAQKRAEEIMLLQQEISAQKLAALQGTIVSVMIDTPAHGQTPATGRTQWDAPEVDGMVYVRGTRAPAGSIVPVRITGTGDYDLYGVVEKNEG